METPTKADWDIPQHASLEECSRCHESIWKYTSDNDEVVVVEAASFLEHECWQTLPEGADFISTD
jgi:hypothetical protein